MINDDDEGKILKELVKYEKYLRNIKKWNVH